MEEKDISRREFLERMGIIGGLGAAYCGMAQFRLPPFAYAHTGPPRPGHHSGKGQHIVILGAGIAGLCAAFLLKDTQFKITVIEPNSYVGGRCLTLRRGDKVGEEGVDRHGNPFPPIGCNFDEGTDFYINTGPGRIPQSHSAIMHYCKKLKIKLQPYIFACRSNLLQNDDYHQGRSIPLRWIKHDLRGHIAELLVGFARANQTAEFVAPRNRESFQKGFRINFRLGRVKRIRRE